MAKAQQFLTGQNEADNPGLFKAAPKKRAGKGVTSGGLTDLPLPAPGLVRFRAVFYDDLGLTAELNGKVTPSGYGGHDVTARPGRTGLSDYSGRPPLSLTIPLLFDRWQTQGSVEAEIAALERMLGITDADEDEHTPPTLIIEGLGIPHSHSRNARLRWNLTGDPQWDDDERTRGTDGHRSFVPVTVTALQIVRPGKATVPDDTRGSGGSSAGKAAPRRYVRVEKKSKLVTLKALAKHFHMTWPDLRRLNPGLPGDPNVKLKPGTRVRYR